MVSCLPTSWSICHSEEGLIGHRKKSVERSTKDRAHRKSVTRLITQFLHALSPSNWLSFARAPRLLWRIWDQMVENLVSYTTVGSQFWHRTMPPWLPIQIGLAITRGVGAVIHIPAPDIVARRQIFGTVPLCNNVSLDLRSWGLGLGLSSPYRSVYFCGKVRSRLLGYHAAVKMHRNGLPHRPLADKHATKASLTPGRSVGAEMFDLYWFYLSEFDDLLVLQKSMGIFVAVQVREIPTTTIIQGSLGHQKKWWDGFGRTSWGEI